jgi:multidrug efflux pump subunit AcrB
LRLAALVAYLVLDGLYESWAIPGAVIVSVTVGLAGALGGLWLTGLPSDVFAQIGIVVLIALATKNGILIVEFAIQAHRGGLAVAEAALSGARARLLPAPIPLAAAAAEPRLRRAVPGQPVRGTEIVVPRRYLR